MCVEEEAWADLFIRLFLCDCVAMATLSGSLFRDISDVM